MTKRIDAKPFAKMWDRVLAYRMTHPDITNKELWEKFGPHISDLHNLNTFKAAILQKGLDRAAIKRATSEKEMTKVAVQTFADKIKQKADQHLNKVSTYLDRAHKVVKDIHPDTENIGSYIDLVKGIHREGRLLYAVDESKSSDPRLLNLALLVSICPEDEDKTEKQAQAVEVESSTEESLD